MALLLSTSGTLGTVVINDLGAIELVHPVTAMDLTDGYTYSELRKSEDLGAALDSGYISITNDGNIVGNSAALRVIEPTVGENNGITTQTQVFTGTMVWQGGFAFGDNFTTPVLNGNKTNYNIPDLRDYPIIIWVSSKDVDIKSIVAPTKADSSIDFQPFVFLNGNSNGKNFKFKKNSGGDAVNRFDIQDDVELKKGEFWWFGYNFLTNRWNAQAKI